MKVADTTFVHTKVADTTFIYKKVVAIIVPPRGHAARSFARRSPTPRSSVKSTAVTSDAQRKVTFWAHANHVGFAAGLPLLGSGHQREPAPLIEPCADGPVYSIDAASSYASRLTGHTSSVLDRAASRAGRPHDGPRGPSRAGSQHYPGGISDRCVLTP